MRKQRQAADVPADELRAREVQVAHRDGDHQPRRLARRNGPAIAQPRRWRCSRRRACGLPPRPSKTCCKRPMIAAIDPREVAELLFHMTPEERAELDALIEADRRAWRPLPGPQLMAWESKADIIGFGGAAGGGKTDLACGLATQRHEKSMILRREATQLTASSTASPRCCRAATATTAPRRSGACRAGRSSSARCPTPATRRSSKAGRTTCSCSTRPPTS
jgi:hypothetical protein